MSEDSEKDSLPSVKLSRRHGWVKFESKDHDTDDDAADIDVGNAGSFNNVQIEAVFSDAHRSQRTTPVATGGWDDASDSGSEPEFIGTIHERDEPWFNVHECKVVREVALHVALDDFELDLDIPLRLRPFMANFQAKALKELRQRLADCVATEFLLSDVPGSARRPEFEDWSQDVVFPVKRRRCGARPSDSPEF